MTPSVDRFSHQLQSQQKIRENKTFAMSKDGIQMLKERLNAEAAEPSQSSSFKNIRFQQPFKQNQFYEPVKLNLNENFKPVPTISRVKLNKLNTNEFLTNPTASNRNYDAYQSNYNNSNYYCDDSIAASDL